MEQEETKILEDRWEYKELLSVIECLKSGQPTPMQLPLYLMDLIVDWRNLELEPIKPGEKRRPRKPRKLRLDYIRGPYFNRRLTEYKRSFLRWLKMRDTPEPRRLNDFFPGRGAPFQLADYYRWINEQLRKGIGRDQLIRNIRSKDDKRQNPSQDILRAVKWGQITQFRS